MTAEQNAREAQQAHDERDLIAQQLDDVQKQLRLLTAAVEQGRGAASPENGPLKE